MAGRVRRANRTGLLVPVVDIAGVKYLLGGTQSAPILEPVPTSNADTLPLTVLQTWDGVLTADDPLAAIGGNITCAIVEDGTEVGQDESDTDDTLTWCDEAASQSPTTANATVTLELLRDADPLADGLFNLAYNLIKGPDVQYAFIDRVQNNTPSSTAFASGDVASIYLVTTDNPVDNTEDGEDITVTQTFTVGDFYQNLEVAA